MLGAASSPSRASSRWRSKDADLERVRLFCRAGCSSGAKTRELLESWGVEFDLVRVEASGPGSAPAPPVLGVAVHGEVVSGWNPRACAALLGVDYQPPTPLDPTELGPTLDRILADTEALIAAVPDAWIECRALQSGQRLRDLAYHVFRLALAFADGMDMGQVREEWLRVESPAELRDGRAVARYGALVRGRVAGWLEGAGAREFQRVITAEGTAQSGNEWLERTTWHAAHHLRQLVDICGALGLPPRPLLSATDVSRLQLPRGLW